jgi:hypothetical protein
LSEDGADTHVAAGPFDGRAEAYVGEAEPYDPGLYAELEARPVYGDGVDRGADHGSDGAATNPAIPGQRRGKWGWFGGGVLMALFVAWLALLGRGTPPVRPSLGPRAQASLERRSPMPAPSATGAAITP